MSTITGVMLSEAANDLKNIVSPGMQNSTIQYIADANGAVTVIIEGATVAEVVTDGASLLDPTTRFIQATNYFNKNNRSGSGNGGKKQGGDAGKPDGNKTPVTENYTYKHGKYDGAGYHQKGKNTDWGGKTKSPEPQNRQKCLDKSCGLDKYIDRVAIEDNKYVVLYSSNDGTYHGFVCSEWKDVPKNMKEIFRDHKLVHPKYGDILKQFRN